MTKEPIPRGHWIVNGVAQDIETMDLAILQTIVDDRRKKGQFIHPLMLKRLGLPPEPRKENPYSDKPKGPQTFRTGVSSWRGQ